MTKQQLIKKAVASCAPMTGSQVKALWDERIARKAQIEREFFDSIVEAVAIEIVKALDREAPSDLR